eukprot:CFRG2997T1
MLLTANSMETHTEIDSLIAHINTILCEDVELKEMGLIPIVGRESLFESVKGGFLLGRLINTAKPSTIQESRIQKNPKNQMHIIENLNVCIDGARRVGCVLVNIGAEDILKEKESLVLSLLSQLAKIVLLDNIRITKHPELIRLVDSGIGEDLGDVLNMAPEIILKRWVNHHLDNAQMCEHRITNFSSDIKDGTAYLYLLHQLAPEVVSLTDDQAEPKKRYETIVSSIEKIGLEKLIGPDDIASGNPRLNMGFLAALFEARPGLHISMPNDSQIIRMQLAQQELEQEVIQLKSVIASLETQQINMEESTAARVTTAVQVFTSQLGETTTLEAELEKAECKLMLEKSRSDQLAVECDDLSEEVGKMTIICDKLNQRVTQKNKTIHTIERRYEEAETKNQAFKTENDELRAEIIALQSALTETLATSTPANPVGSTQIPKPTIAQTHITPDGITPAKRPSPSSKSQQIPPNHPHCQLVDSYLNIDKTEYEEKYVEACKREEELKMCLMASQRETEKHQEYILKLKREIMERTRLLEENYRNKLESERKLKQANKSMQILLKSRDKGAMMNAQLQSLYTAFPKHEKAATVMFKNLSAYSVEQKKGLIQKGLIKRHVKGIAVETYAVLIQNWLFLYHPDKKDTPTCCFHIDTWHISRMTVPGQHILTLQQSDSTAVLHTVELIDQKTQEEWYVGLLRAAKWWTIDDDNVTAILEKEKKKTAQSMQKIKIISLAEAQQSSRFSHANVSASGEK